LGIVFQSVGSGNFQFAAERFIKLLIELQRPESRENGVGCIYLFSAWQRIHLSCPDLIIARLDRIMPHLLLLAEHSILEDIAEEQKSKQAEDDEESSEGDENTKEEKTN
jgi:hypothetical protein